MWCISVFLKPLYIIYTKKRAVWLDGPLFIRDAYGVVLLLLLLLLLELSSIVGFLDGVSVISPVAT